MARLLLVSAILLSGCSGGTRQEAVAIDQPKRAAVEQPHHVWIKEVGGGWLRADRIVNAVQLPNGDYSVWMDCGNQNYRISAEDWERIK